MPIEASQIVVLDTNVIASAFKEKDVTSIYFTYKVLIECCRVAVPSDREFCMWLVNPLPREWYRYVKNEKSFWQWWDELAKSRKILHREVSIERIPVPKSSNVSDNDRAFIALALETGGVLVCCEERGVVSYFNSPDVPGTLKPGVLFLSSRGEAQSFRCK